MVAIPFFNTKDGSWVVAKTQRCMERLVFSLEQFVGSGGLCSWPPGTLSRRPKGWSVDRWLDARTQMAADFLTEFKSPRRGFYLGSDTCASVIPGGVMANPLLDKRDEGVLDLSGQRKGPGEGELRVKRIRNKYVNKELESHWRGERESVAALLEALGPVERETEQHLIRGLPPLNVFLHTDKCVHACELISYSPPLLMNTVQKGDFDVSPLTPLDSLLRVWAVSSQDKREDHTACSPLEDAEGRWEEPQSNVMADWGGEVEVEEDYEECDEGSSHHASEEDTPGGSANESDRGSGNQHITSGGGDEGGVANTVSRPQRFADRSARVAIMAVESSVLRGRLWRGFIESNGGLQRADTNQRADKKYLSEMREAQQGLERYAHLGLMLHSAAAPHGDRDKEKDNADGDDEESSLGSGCAVASLSGELTRNSSSVSSNSGRDASYQSSVIARLNTTIRSLLVDWDKRREASKERAGVENKAASTSTVTTAASPRSSSLVTLLKNCRYRPEPDAPLCRYPSQLRPLTPLSSSALSAFTTSRAKTRLSRRSERVMIMDRMQAMERAFHNRRLTSVQMVTLLRGISGSDETQHAALLFIVRLTDITKINESRDFFRSLELSAEGEKRVKLVSLVLSAQGRAEEHLVAIHEKYVKCFLAGQTISALEKEIKDEDGGSFASFLSLPGNGMLSSELRSKMTSLRAKLSTMRQAVGKVHGWLNAGFALHLTPLQREQDAVRKATGLLRKVVSKCEETCRLRGTLTAGRPEYLVLHRLKAAQSCSEKARAVVGEAADEATALLSTVQGNLKVMEGSLAATAQSSVALLEQCRDSSQGAAIGEKGSGRESDAAAVEAAIEALLEDRGARTDSVDMKSSMATLTGLTAACAGAGWRRSLQEVATENCALFKSLIVPQNSLDSVVIDTLHRAESHMANNASMCLLLSRIPFMRDVLASSGSSSGCGNGKGEDEGSMDREGAGLDGPLDRDDFSYAVYDDCNETF